MAKLTPKMQKAIGMIEKAMGLKYRGKTFEDALKFIGSNIDKARSVDMWTIEKPTEKQLKAIEICEETMGVVFTGTNKRDASNFLDQYFPKAQAIMDETVRGY